MVVIGQGPHQAAGAERLGDQGDELDEGEGPHVEMVTDELVRQVHAQAAVGEGDRAPGQLQLAPGRTVDSDVVLSFSHRTPPVACRV